LKIAAMRALDGGATNREIARKFQRGDGRLGSLHLPCAQSSPPANADGVHLRVKIAAPMPSAWKEEHVALAGRCSTPQSPS